MDIRQITDTYAVSPQINASDMTSLAAAGFTTVINNRPDAEVVAEQQSNAMKAAAEAAGLAYVENPVINGALTMEMVNTQRATADASKGPVFAWCRSGTRSAIVWAMSQAGERQSDEIVALLSKAGYEIPDLGVQLDALADQHPE